MRLYWIAQGGVDGAEMGREMGVRIFLSLIFGRDGGFLWGSYKLTIKF
jgi:hypothetical protein